jgi:hypothetical protein
MKKTSFTNTLLLFLIIGLIIGGCSSTTAPNYTELDSLVSVEFRMSNTHTENPRALLLITTSDNVDNCLVELVGYTFTDHGTTKTIQLTGETALYDLCSPRPFPLPNEFFSGLFLDNLENNRYTINIRNGNKNNIINIIKVDRSRLYYVETYNFQNIEWRTDTFN